MALWRGKGLRAGRAVSQLYDPARAETRPRHSPPLTAQRMPESSRKKGLGDTVMGFNLFPDFVQEADLKDAYVVLTGREDVWGG